MPTIKLTEHAIQNQTTIDVLIEEVINHTTKRELSFAKKILDGLENVPTSIPLYWDFNDTLLSHKGSKHLQGTAIRPGANPLLDYLSKRGFKHGTYTIWHEDLINKAMNHDNNIVSIRKYFSPELIKSTFGKETTQRKKHEVFLEEIKQGVLIDDGYFQKEFDGNTGTISVMDNQANYLNITGVLQYIPKDDAFKILGTGL